MSHTFDPVLLELTIWNLMPTSPITSGLELLLSALDADPQISAERYEILRLKITKVLAWKGCPDSRSEALADEVLDRICEKLLQGEIIRDINAYASGVVRFVFLEYSRRNIVDTVGDDLPEVVVAPDLSSFDGEDARMSCLRTCLEDVAPKAVDRELIVRYYDPDPDTKNKRNRKSLAESLGITPNALKVRACRLRVKLEQCINHCLDRVTKTPAFNTNDREGR